jgi:hypothetical protein
VSVPTSRTANKVDPEIGPGGYKSPLPEAVYKVVESIAMLRTGEASVVEVQEDAPESNS